MTRYSRQVILPGFGEEGQSRLARAKVLVVGLGGLGSAVVPSLAAAGVGTLGLVDDDVVELSNLARQTVHRVGSLGMSKVESARQAIAELNPDTRVVGHDERLTAANALALFADYDLVLDGSDNFPTRYLVNDAAELRGIPAVWGAMHQYGGQVGVSWASRGPTYRDVFPVPPAPGTVQSCAEAGVLPTLAPVIGGLMATEALKILTGIGEPLLGRVTTYDSLRGTFREVAFEPDPTAERPGSLIDYDAFCGIDEDAESGSMTVNELRALLAGDARLRLVDVREEWEATVGIDGAILLPFTELLADPIAAGEKLRAVGADVPTTVLYCEHGPRSRFARSLLAENGVVGLRYLAGGMTAWPRG